MKSKPKVAVIGLKGLPAFGGAASVGENIIEQLKDRYNFTVYSTSSHTDLKTGNHNGFHQIVFKKKKFQKLNITIYYIKSAYHCLFKKEYDLIHLHHTTGSFIIPFLRLKYPVLSTSHGMPEKNKRWNFLIRIFFKLMEYTFLNFSNSITSVSKPLALYYQDKTRKKIHYIPNGINKIKTQDSNKKEKDYLLFVAGRIIPAKGCHIFLEALKKIGYKGKVIVIGNLDIMPTYKIKIKELKRDLNAKFIDFLKDKDTLFSYINNSKFLIFPSSNEAMSITLLEAISLKKPIICSDIPANKSILSNNECLFFETDNPINLSDKIKWALANESTMESKAKKAYERILKTHSWKNISRMYFKLYQELV